MKSIATVLFALLFASAAWAGPAEESIAEGRKALAARDVVKAMAAFSAALEADPRNMEAAYERGRILLVIGEPGNAVADFTTAILGDPAFGRAYAGRAEAKLVLKDAQSAIADFDQLPQVTQLALHGLAVEFLQVVEIVRIKMRPPNKGLQH